MSRTLKIPIAIDARGAAVQTDSSAVQLVLASLVPSRTDNPFDDRDGLQVEDPAWTSQSDAGVIEARVSAAFARLERQGIARLSEIRRETAIDGEVAFVVDWIDLQTGDSGEAVLPSGVGG